MKAIILAAGIGSRLVPITSSKPKTLVKVNGKPMLGYILDALTKHGINDVVVCTGYCDEQIRNYCENSHSKQRFTFVHNEEFRSSNNLYSLYLASPHLEGDLLLMNADLVFDDKVIGQLTTSPTSAIAVDVGRYLEESMKVTVQDGVINGISKKMPSAAAHGCSIDVYRFTAADATAIRAAVKEAIEVKGMRNEWTELLLNDLFVSGAVKPVACAIGDARWMEIDNFEDLQVAETLFNEHLPRLAEKKIFFLDRDGTLTVGSSIIPGVPEFLAALKRAGKKVVVLTNNSSRTPNSHVGRLNELGLELSDDEVAVSTEQAVAYLKQQGMTRVFWVANPAVSEYLQECGLVYEENSPQAVLLTYDNTLNYEKFSKLALLVAAGIPYYATHIDLACPTEKGFVPDIGSFIEAIKVTNGCVPNRTFGKPDMAMIDAALERFGLTQKDAVVIGDRLYTDIKMTAGTELTTVLVLSGETKREDYEDSECRADIITPSVRSLGDWL